MKITRMYKGDDGQSHFEELEAPQRETRVGAISEWLDAEAILFRRVSDDLFLDWHNADSRVLIVILTGALEVVVGEGEKRRFEAGDMVLAEDVDGPGHQTRDVEWPRESIMIRVPESFRVDDWKRIG